MLPASPVTILCITAVRPWWVEGGRSNHGLQGMCRAECLAWAAGTCSVSVQSAWPRSFSPCKPGCLDEPMLLDHFKRSQCN